MNSHPKSEQYHPLQTTNYFWRKIQMQKVFDWFKKDVFPSALTSNEAKSNANKPSFMCQNDKMWQSS